MDPNSQLSWHEVSPSNWERDIDEAEQFYTSMARLFEKTGHKYFAITACLSIFIPNPTKVSPETSSQSLTKALQKAWVHCRHDYPSLAAPATYDPISKWCKKTYHVPGPGDIERWLDESFKLISTEQTGSDFANTDPEFSGPTIFIIIPPNQEPGRTRRDIVFRSPHDIVDGIGSLLLLNNLLEHAASYFSADTTSDLRFTNQHAQEKLSPTFREAANLPPTPTPSQLSKLHKTQTTNASLQKDITVLKASFKNPYSPPQSSRRVSIHLTTQQTSAILTACKASKATPTHAFHTGIALALLEIQERMSIPKPARYMSYSLINLRPACTLAYSTPKHAVSVYHCISDSLLSIDLTIPAATNATQEPIPPPKSTFTQTLEKVRNFYQGVNINNKDYLSIVPSLFASKLPNPPYSPSLPDLPPPNLTPSISLSSFGLLDRIIAPEYGSLEIREPWLVGSEYSTGVGLFLGTWMGSMCLSASFNETYHDDDEIVGFLKGVKRVVLKGFGIEL